MLNHPTFAAACVAGCLWAAASGAEPSPIRFDDATERSGLVELLAGLMGHGGAWGDFDSDGRIDLFAGGFSDRPNAEYAPASGPIPNKLFRNLGEGRFESVTNPALQIFARTSGAVFADLDNNGTLDLYVANNAKQKAGKGAGLQLSAKAKHSQLFRNNNGTMVDVSAESGACPDSLYTVRNVGVLDFDNDGLLDLFVVEDKFTSAPRSVLLRNLGGLKFQDVTREVGLPEDIFGLGLATADVNKDGRPDIFVGHSNRLFVSQPGNKYREALDLASVFHFEPFDGEDWPCGVAFGDLNRDGQPELVVSAHGVRARNRLFLHEGVKDGMPQYREVTGECGLDDVIPAKCPHVEIQDFDNDGWPDIYFSAAWIDDKSVTPLIYRHVGLKDGLPRFAPPRNIEAPMAYYPAGPSGDYDNDGRLDLFLINWFAGNHSRLLHNESPVLQWLQVTVRGRTVNRMGIGSKIWVYKAGQINKPESLLGSQEISIGFGYASGQPAIAHFGLGEAAEVDVLVRYPDGSETTHPGVKSNQFLKVTQP